MAIHDEKSQRLHVDIELAAGARVNLDAAKAHYLADVLRLGIGGHVLLFNGHNGEWRAEVREMKKRAVELAVIEQTRLQSEGPDLAYLFAPLKHARLDYMVQKAVEMGVARLSPVSTRRTVPHRVNVERMQANAIEAAEQCGVLRVPKIDLVRPLEAVLDSWNPARRIVFCDEAAERQEVLAVLAQVEPGPLAVLIGPEGGFDESERQLLLGKPFVVPISLGPRVMRADTAAVAALALVNATLGDWALRAPITAR